jgi:polysaccharide biosynthesis/export protein
MRVTRSILLLLALAITAGGCGFQPAPWMAVTQGPVAVQRGAVVVPVAPAPAPGIDNTVYGPVVAAPPPPPPETGRGLFVTGAVPAPVLVPPVVAPRFAPPPPGFVAPPPVVQIEPAPVAFAPAEPNRPYTLDSGDRLRVVVFGQDGLSNSYVVDASGYIAMPLIGSVLARGATTSQLSDRISDKLRQGFVKEPHVAVEIEAYRPFFILGEVTQPGQYPYVADMTVETAVAIAGGFAPRAFRRTVQVTRVIHGEQVCMTVPTSFVLRPGDTVNVQERWF